MGVAYFLYVELLNRELGGFDFMESKAVSPIASIKREHSYDIAKGIAMILVIIGHCKFVPETMKWWLYSFHMPLFFMISGMLLNVEKYSFISFVKNKLRTLVLPYFCMSFVLYVWDVLIRIRSSNLDTHSFAKKFVGIFLAHRNSDYYYSLWFLTALFFAELSIYVIVKISKNKPPVIFIFMFLLSVAGFYITAKTDKGFYWSLDLVPMSAAFLAIGYLLRLYLKKDKKLFHPILFPLYCVINLVFAYLNHKSCGELGRSDMYYLNLGNYIYYMIGAVAGSFAVITFSRFVKKMSAVEYIGKNSLIYYTFQQTIFIPMFTAVVKELEVCGGVFENKYFKLIFVVAFTCLALAICSYIITTCFPFLMGKPFSFKKSDSSN